LSLRKPELEAFIGFKLSPEMLAKIHSIVEEYAKKELEKVVRKVLDEKLEEVIRKCLEEKEKVAEKEVLKLRKIPHKEAIALIKEYINEHQGCRTSDIIYDLALDPDLVLRVLKELEEKKEIRGE
jgi:hypothetical protein